MTEHRSLWDWALDYVGDPQSWVARGEMITCMLQDNGLEPNHNLLDIGCGNLSEGAPLIRYLAAHRFTGIEPNGWLVEVALRHFPDLLDKQPEFLWRTDFDATDAGVRFDFIVSHSVLSHCAHWQLDQFLSNTRKVVDEGAVMLASFIEDQYNGHADQWVYPGVNTFRLRTVMAAGYQFGWHVEMVSEYRDRMVAVAPNDTHQWLRMTAIPTAAELNDRRLEEEAVQRGEVEALQEREKDRKVALDIASYDRERVAGLLP